MTYSAHGGLVDRLKSEGWTILDENEEIVTAQKMEGGETVTKRFTGFDLAPLLGALSE